MMLYIIMIIFSPITAVIPGIYAIYLIFKRKVKVEKNYFNIGMGILFIWSVIVAILNNSILSFIGSLLILAYFSVGVIAQRYFDSRKKINKFLKYITYLTALTAINGIVEKCVYMYIGKPEHRIISAYGNPNMTGAWFASIILVILYLKGITKEKRQNNIYNLCIVLISLGLVLTESTGAFVAFIVSVVCFYLLKHIRNLKKLMVVFGGIASITMLFILLQSKGHSQGIVNEVNTSFTSRYDIWIGSLKMIAEKPLMGWGILGTLEKGNIYFYNNGNSIHSHNVYLTFLVSGGIFALGIYLYMKYNIFKNLFKLYKRREPLLPLLVGLNMMIIVQGLVDCTLYAPQLGVLFMITCAITINLTNRRVKANKKNQGEIIDLEIKSIAI